MICPLLACGVLATPDQGKLSRLNLAGEQEQRAGDRASECLKEACGWWIPGAEMCAVKALGMQAASTKISLDVKIDAYEEGH